MKKLEKMDGKLFESLKPNEMSNLCAMVGGRYDQATLNGKDFYTVFETFGNTWENGASTKDNLREDSRSAVYYYEGVNAILSNNDLTGVSEIQIDVIQE